jgi:cytochrome c peroxidase
MTKIKNPRFYMKWLSSIIILYSSSLLAQESLELIGERLFRDGRFSKNFYDASFGQINQELPSGVNLGQSVSCFSCHRLDQDFTESGRMRGYNDDLAVTPIPYRIEDGRTHTFRNTPSLIGIGSRFAQNRFSHFDGEMSDHKQTVLGNFTGRNMGWIQSEKDLALKQIVKVIKEDNGDFYLGTEFGGAYSKVFLGIDPEIPENIRLPVENRLDVFSATDEDIIQLVEKCIDRYMNGLDFSKDENLNYQGSPYDQFLKVNLLPLSPLEGENINDYTIRLRNALIGLESPRFIPKKYFTSHHKEFGFNKKEWEGLKKFFNLKSSGNGQCLNCHQPPLFTDQQFHNVGITQMEYDEHFGHGAFNQINFPENSRDQNRPYLFLKTDLGMWNFYGRDNNAILTHYVNNFLCGSDQACLNQDHLSKTLARFKTPSLRNLGHSEPYMHNGRFKTIKDTIVQYQDASKLMTAGKLKNGAPQLRMMKIHDEDIDSLAAFLEALNEDYE